MKIRILILKGVLLFLLNKIIKWSFGPKNNPKIWDQFFNRVQCTSSSGGGQACRAWPTKLKILQFRINSFAYYPPEPSITYCLFSAQRNGQKKILSPKDPDIVSLAKESVSFSMVRYWLLRWSHQTITILSLFSILHPGTPLKDWCLLIQTRC